MTLLAAPVKVAEALLVAEVVPTAVLVEEMVATGTVLFPETLLVVPADVIGATVVVDMAVLDPLEDVVDTAEVVNLEDEVDTAETLDVVTGLTIVQGQFVMVKVVDEVAV